VTAVEAPFDPEQVPMDTVTSTTIMASSERSAEGIDPLLCID